MSSENSAQDDYDEEDLEFEILDAKAIEFLPIAQEALAKAEDAFSTAATTNSPIPADLENFLVVRRNVMISIVFAAFTAEALINNYIDSRESRQFVRKALDRLSTIAKWRIAPELFTGKQVDAGREPLQGLKTLMDIRNTLAHPKSKRLSPEEADKLPKMSIDDARGGVRTVKALIRWLTEMDDEIDAQDLWIPRERTSEDR